MEARLFISPKTRATKSSYEMILDWMQRNPNLCRNTNATSIARAVSLSKENPYTTDSLKQAIIRMVDNQMIYRFNGIRRATFRINYLHKMIPQSILDTAPEEAKEYRRDTIGGVKPNQHLDEVGCIVTKSERKEEEVKEEVTITEQEEPKEETQQVVSSDMSEENTVSVPLEIKDTKNGLSISITLNLNINK